jgi:hypothetical protein
MKRNRQKKTLSFCHTVIYTFYQNYFISIFLWEGDNRENTSFAFVLRLGAVSEGDHDFSIIEKQAQI